MKTKKNIMIESWQHEHLVKVAEKKGISFSQLLCDAAERCHPQSKDDHIVILKIPKNLKNEELESWLESRISGIYDSLNK